MKINKKYLKLLLGTAVLLLFGFIFFFLQKSSDLENAKMDRWTSASVERRNASIKILTDDDDVNKELMLQCMNKIASLPNSSEMSVRDSAALCYTGIKLKQNI